MTDKITLTNLVNLQNETTAVNAINANNAALTTAIDNTLSRDGTSPNTMGANLDMNNSQIINLPSPATLNSPARLVDVTGVPTLTIPPIGTSGGTVPLLNSNSTFSGNNTFSGNSNFTGTASFSNFNTAASVPNNSVTNAMLVNVGANTVKGSIAGGAPADLTKTQVTSLVNPVTASLSGAIPAFPNNTTTYFRGDGTYANSSPVLLNTLAASNSSSIFDSTNITANFSNYEIVFNNILPQLNGAILTLLVRSGGVYQITNYITQSYAPNAVNVSSAQPTTYIALSGNTTNAAPGISGKITLYNPSSVYVHQITGLATYASTGVSVPYTISGYWNSFAVVDGVQLIFTSGNIASGTVKIYGIL